MAGFALVADMVYVQQSAGRYVIYVDSVGQSTSVLTFEQNPSSDVRNLSEAWMGPSHSRRLRSLQNGRTTNVSLAPVSYLHLSLIKGSRWGSMTPLRQFRGVPADVIRKAEGKQFVSVPAVSIQ